MKKVEDVTCQSVHYRARSLIVRKTSIQCKQARQSPPREKNLEIVCAFRFIELVDIFQRLPVVIEDLDIGSCKTRWTVQYLREKGQEKDITVHVSEHGQMNFLKKNFLYK